MTGTGDNGVKKPLLKIKAVWAAVGLLLLVAVPRLTALNQYLIVDETDRWLWAKAFVQALSRGNLAGTLVGDGYPGIVPVWVETVWVFLEAVRRSLLEGRWIGDAGLGHLLHEWDRNAMLIQQRLPVVLFNTLLALAIIWVVWRLFGLRVALFSGVFIALDPFYLSDSRVNRAEAVITGLMTLSILFLIFYARHRQWRYVVLSGIFGGLSFLTKIQALALLPTIAVVGLYLELSGQRAPDGWRETAARLASPGFWWPVIRFGLVWAMSAAAIWVILWPSMWVAPLDTLALVYNYTTRKVGAEGVNLFFMGRTYRDSDPGLLFYPVVLLMRLSPLTLLGLVIWGTRRIWQKPHPAAGERKSGVFILTTYALLYAIVMTVGSHKQDRYLMPVFLGLDILAAMQWAALNFEVKIQNLRLKIQNVLFPLLVVIQLAVVLPHHPYYYSYFNPLFGGGRTAVNTLRIGWGEGMDRAGAYLAAKPNSKELVVGARFGRNMLDFKGELVTLGPDGAWTRADYIVLYIQQVQRQLDPSPGFIDYFQARTPEKVITVGGIEYAWIYPIPFTTPANPRVSAVSGQAALLGYSWQLAPDGGYTIRPVWENLGLSPGRNLAARLSGDAGQTGWQACAVDPAFARQAKTAGAYVESVCPVAVGKLPAGLYTVEFGLTAASRSAGKIEPFLFPEGRFAARITPGGVVEDTPEMERLAEIIRQEVPPDAFRPDRIYDGRIRLAAYRLNPPRPTPGRPVGLTLYWQVVKAVTEPVTLTVQLADSRLLPLGRDDRPLPAAAWLPGQVMTTTHRFDLPPGLDPPLAAQLEVTLTNPAEVALRSTTLGGVAIDAVAGRFTVAPPERPLPPTPVTAAVWQTEAGRRAIALRGYGLNPDAPRPGETLSVTLYWEALLPVEQSYQVFVHLLDSAGQIVAQHDSLPRAGGYPTPWWQPGDVIEDTHPLALPAGLPGGQYRLAIGLYRPEDGQRLRLAGGQDSFAPGLVNLP